MYVICQGRVRILKRVDGEDVCLAVLGPGEFFGELGLLPTRRSVTAVVERDALLVAIDAETFGQILADTPELSHRILDRLGQRLREADERLVRSMTRDGPTRVAKALLELAAAVEPDARGRLQLGDALDAGLLAGRAGVLPSQVDAVRRQLEAVGVLGRRADGGWWVASRRALEDYADYCDRKRRLDPLSLDELAELAGLERPEVEVLAERVIAKRLRSPEPPAEGRGLRSPLQRYLELKLRFEFHSNPQPRAALDGTVERA
jgi:CRP-like cAMP-binding protein